MAPKWKLICDRSGFDCYNDAVEIEWTGLIVRRDWLDLRSPQEFVRGRKDRQSVPNPRPEAADTFLSENEVQADDL